MSDDDENYVYSEDEEWDEASDDEEDEHPPKQSRTEPSLDAARKAERGRERADSSAGLAGRPRLGDSEYCLIERADVAKTMAAKAKEVSELLNVTTSAAEALLRGSGWSSERLMESFMADSDKLSRRCGVETWEGGADVATEADRADDEDGAAPETTEEEHQGAAATAAATNAVAALDAMVPLARAPGTGTTRKSKEVTCRICCTEVPAREALGAPCGHLFCAECYEGYLTTKADEGPQCVDAPCPEDKCRTLVPPNLWSKVLTEAAAAATSSSTGGAAQQQHPALAALAKYRKYRIDNFITFSKELRWCPAPGCDKVARAGPCVTSVKCAPGGCGYAFCMKCGDEAHQPASCELLRLWQEKCQNESETANWILANTKRCPKCQTRIEKNQGCNHMSCSQCKHEFCWMCMGDWSEHGASTGGYYKCNKFDPLKTGDEEDDTARAKRELDRYLHFYKRYHGHDQAQKFASKQLEATEKRMVELQESTHGSWIDVQFLKTANEMVIDCRRTLKSTYVFGYYLDQTAHKQRELFENLQEHLERFTETLSELTELPLDKMDRTEVVNITRVTESFLHNLIVGAENGLELDAGAPPVATGPPAAASKKPAPASSAKPASSSSSSRGAPPSGASSSSTTRSSSRRGASSSSSS